VVQVTKRTRIVQVGAGAVLIAALSIAGYLHLRGRRPGAPEAKGRPPIAIEVGEEPPEPSVWIDVHAPAKVWRSVRANAWLAQAMSEPLGQGMAAGWAGFLATKGSDLAGAFDGMVLDVVAERLLADPFRVVFYAGPDATGAPAVLVPRPSSAARGAYELLEGVARKGRYRAQRCPGPKPKAGGGGLPLPSPGNGEPIDVSRWLLAEQAVFAGERGGRIAIGKSPLAVVQALCAAPAGADAAPGEDVSLTFSPDALGREARLGAALLGLGPALRLSFAVEGDRLEPRGISGALGAPARLGAAAPPDSLLGLVPADAGVVFVATLRLPAELTRASLSQHLGGSYRGPLAERPVAVVWNPRGERRLPTEVAVIWPEADAALLRDAFSGPNRMEHRRLCGHEVYASTVALAAALQSACRAERPSILHASPDVAGGMKRPASIAVGMNLGAVLPRLLGDARSADPERGKRPSPEADLARRRLEELPFIGLRGVVEGGALLPGGFRS
jgi:hypothetical protein